MRIAQAIIRAIQNPNKRPDMMNLCFFFRFSCRIVICVTAPPRNKARKTTVMGTSVPTVGTPPSDAVVCS